MNGLSAYKENSITTQSMGKIVVMLYEGAVKFIKQAIAAIDRNDFAEKGRCINRALAIIEELNLALDMETGGEVAQNLRSLYHFMISYLTQASIQKDTQKMQKVITLLTELNEGWKGISA